MGAVGFALDGARRGRELGKAGVLDNIRYLYLCMYVALRLGGGSVEPVVPFEGSGVDREAR